MAKSRGHASSEHAAEDPALVAQPQGAAEPVVVRARYVGEPVASPPVASPPDHAAMHIEHAVQHIPAVKTASHSAQATETVATQKFAACEHT